MELDAFDELVEVLLVDVDAVHVDRGAQVLVELVGRPLLARVADDPQIFESLAVFEREQRGEQQPGGEVARCAEHDERRLIAHERLLTVSPNVCAGEGHATAHARMCRERSPNRRGSKTRSGNSQPPADDGEPVAVLPDQDRMQTEARHLQHREVACGRCAASAVDRDGDVRELVHRARACRRRR